MIVGCVFMGCAKTIMVSFRDPGANSKRYHKFMVMVLGPDLLKAQWREKLFQSHFESNGLEMEISTNIFVPTRDYSESEIKNVLQKHSIDGVLLVKLTDRREEEVQIMPREWESEGEASTFGGTTTWTETTREVEGVKGTAIEEKYHISLVDGKMGKTVWVASSHTGGTVYARSKTLLKSLASKILRQLVTDGLVVLE